MDLPPATRKRKTGPRALIACESCRTRKLRCNQDYPCAHCVRLQQPCNYRSAPTMRLPGPQATPNLSDDIRALPKDHVEKRIRTDTIDQEDLQTPTASSVIEAQVECENSFGEVNRHTQGTEYYGPTGVYSFLLRLRSRARSQNGESDAYRRSENRSSARPGSMRNLSIVNFLHTSDYQSPQTLIHGQDTSGRQSSKHSNESLYHRAAPEAYKGPVIPTAVGSSFEFHDPLLSPPSSNQLNLGSPTPQVSNQATIERECLRLYFQNLHLIHPIIEESTFLARCETELFNQERQPNDDFVALFYAVLAVGAITAGQDTLLMKNAPAVASIQVPTFLPLKFAKHFFAESKAYLGDVFEACSLERVQTLFLLAIFCQNALKPHSCYMYSGMAVRSAFALGLPNMKGGSSPSTSALWWALYAHEVEMCASTGREAILREPSSYRVPLPYASIPHDPKQAFSEHMVALAHLLRELNQQASPIEWSSLSTNDSAQSLELDQRLLKWKSDLPRMLDMDVVSLMEPEWLLKQKIVLALRFHNVRTLIHRPFLIAAVSKPSADISPDHTLLCVNASRSTIDLLFNSYANRPYFRTWWYNTTYALYASMVLLYVVICDICPQGLSREQLLLDVERSLEIFSAMDQVPVARRCAELTQELLETAKQSPPKEGIQMSRRQTPVATMAMSSGVEVESDSLLHELTREDFFAGLVEPNLMDAFGLGDGTDLSDFDLNSVLGPDLASFRALET